MCPLTAAAGVSERIQDIQNGPRPGQIVTRKGPFIAASVNIDQLPKVSAAGSIDSTRLLAARASASASAGAAAGVAMPLAATDDATISPRKLKPPSATRLLPPGVALPPSILAQHAASPNA